MKKFVQCFYNDYVKIKRIEFYKQNKHVTIFVCVQLFVVLTNLIKSYPPFTLDQTLSL